ncbi:unnamed protein product [Effrenium voratum]|uniref:Uncharacterized protein n=1 Tax=Effrenium voratum TaxID=2562239 RepID=A0AA36NLI1_9DINO|nr:unnamed protein product [Effrenium voratum]CAJ1428228.1 unnamed protein product [Effrenium voratum]
MSRRVRCAWRSVLLLWLLGFGQDTPDSFQLPSTRAAQLPPRHRSEPARPKSARSAAAPSGFVTLDKDHLLLPDEEIFRGVWSEALVAKSLQRAGASQLTWSNHRLSFAMEMNIPWQQVDTVERWRKGEGRGAGGKDFMVNSTVLTARKKNSWHLGWQNP